MNENFAVDPFDSSEDEELSRAIERFSDGECSLGEQADLFDRLDATPGAWKQCALALVETRDLRASLAGLGRSRTVPNDSFGLPSVSHSISDRQLALAPRDEAGESNHSRRRQIVPLSALALGLALSFAAGFFIAPREASEVASPEQGVPPSRRDAIPVKESEPSDPRRSDENGGKLIASDVRPQPDTSSDSHPEMVNVVYRPSGGALETSAPLPVYTSDEEWARVLDGAVRQSEADLAERRAQLLLQGADLERQIVLHPVATEQGEMLLPVETFQIVPVTLSSFH